MAIYRTSLGFAQLRDDELDVFTERILAAMTGNPAFLTPSPSLAEVRSALAVFTEQMAAAQGGMAATAAKNGAREALVALLRPLAAYVDVTAKNDLPVLLSSGFEAVSRNRAQSPLPQPSIRAITNGESTKLTLRVTPLSNAHAYEYQSRTGSGAWGPTVASTQARKIVVPDLVPGTMYTFQVRGVGGSTGYSPWSASLSHMAT